MLVIRTLPCTGSSETCAPYEQWGRCHMQSFHFLCCVSRASHPHDIIWTIAVRKARFQALTQKAHMPQHMAPRGLLPSQCAHESSRSVLFGLTDISKIQGIGCRKLSVFGLPVCRTV